MLSLGGLAPPPALSPPLEGYGFEEQLDLIWDRPFLGLKP